MPKTPSLHPVFKSMNKPLTILGADRRLFFLALVVSAAMFNLLDTFLGAIVMFLALYMLALWATASDPQILRILLRSSQYQARYDPAKRAEFHLERIASHD